MRHFKRLFKDSNFVLHIVDEINPEDISIIKNSLGFESATKAIEKIKSKTIQSQQSDVSVYTTSIQSDTSSVSGHISIFFEGISFIAAQAIQNAQISLSSECFTYLDLDSSPILPSYCGNNVQAKWLDLYNKCITILPDYLEEIYSNPSNTDETIWKKEIQTKIVNIARGFIPCGCSAQMYINVSLENAQKILSMLQFHPLSELRELAQNTLATCIELYPKSFKYIGEFYTKEQMKWLNSYAHLMYYPDSDLIVKSYNYIRTSSYSSEIPKLDNTYRTLHSILLRTRPKHMEVPAFMLANSSIELNLILDFGSFIEMLNYRNLNIIMPVIDASHGFNSWYINQLPAKLQEAFTDSICTIIDDVQVKNLSAYNKQYLFPFGMLVKSKIIGNYSEMVKLAEATVNSVHTPLRTHMLEFAHDLEKLDFPIHYTTF